MFAAGQMSQAAMSSWLGHSRVGRKKWMIGQAEVAEVARKYAYLWLTNLKNQANKDREETPSIAWVKVQESYYLLG